MLRTKLPIRVALNTWSLPRPGCRSSRERYPSWCAGVVSYVGAPQVNEPPNPPPQNSGSARAIWWTAPSSRFITWLKITSRRRLSLWPDLKLSIELSLWRGLGRLEKDESRDERGKKNEKLVTGSYSPPKFAGKAITTEFRSSTVSSVHPFQSRVVQQRYHINLFYKI